MLPCRHLPFSDWRPRETAKIAARLPRVVCEPPDLDYALPVFRKDSLVVCAFPEPSQPFSMYVAARNHRELRRFEAEFGIGLCWN